MELDNLLSCELELEITILGFADEHNVVFLDTDIGVFMVNLDIIQFKFLSLSEGTGFYYPFTVRIRGICLC
uniref:Uncharacterized protein n=1 Tax=Leersia perrieri TaxID=77586 RepID=A0A0D9XHP1_9ORYZ